MRVLLINPYYPLTEMPSPPLGLCYVAAAFERAGATVRILDLVVSPYSRDRIEKLLREFRPRLVGATCVTMSFNAAMMVLRDTKAIDPSIITVMGGPHVTYRARETLVEEPALDLAVLGEGETIVAEMTAILACGQGIDALKRVPGITLRDGDAIHESMPREHRVDVRKLPLPARHLVPMERYRALDLAASMITSRGCPFQCIFCVGRKMSGAKVRYRDAVDVVDEMELLAKLGFSQINIADDLFTAKKKHCFAICDEIIRRGLNVRWTAFSRANTVSPDLLAKLKEAGCVHLSFGFESANEEILKTVNKRIDRSDMMRAVEMCREAGMSAQASFIYGLPGETPGTMEETAEFRRLIHSLGMESGIHLLAPFPGTLVRERAAEYGVRILTDDWSQYTANSAIVETPGTNSDSLEKDVIALQQMVMDQVAEICRKVEEGTATEEDRQRYNKLDRMGIFYEIMMQDLLAEPLAVPAGAAGDAEDLLSHLVDRVVPHIIFTPARVQDAMRHALEHDLFSIHRDGAGLHLDWSEFWA